MIELLAEGTSEAAFTMSHFLEFMVVLSTLALTIVTVWLTIATKQMYKATLNEVAHLSDNAADANDNMTDVALAEIAVHHQDRVRNLRKVASKKRRH